jgi:hypothetical protein
MLDTLLEENGEMAFGGAALSDEVESTTSAETPLRMIVVLPGVDRQLHVERRQVLGREMWAVDEEECWPGMVMDLRRLSADVTAMTWDGEVLLSGSDLVLRPLPEQAKPETAASFIGGLSLYLVEQDVASDDVLALDRAVVRASSKDEACALVAEWLQDEANRLDRPAASADDLFALEIGAADPNDVDRAIVVARSRE